MVQDRLTLRETRACFEPEHSALCPRHRAQRFLSDPLRTPGGCDPNRTGVRPAASIRSRSLRPDTQFDKLQTVRSISFELLRRVRLYQPRNVRRRHRERGTFWPEANRTRACKGGPRRLEAARRAAQKYREM